MRSELICSEADITPAGGGSGCTRVGTGAGLPSISLPLGTHKNGLPFGLQMIGRNFDEKNIFNFAGRDPYGDSTVSSPIWIRPKSLQKANRDTLRDQFIQVVGHTQQNKIDREGKSTGGRYYYIDTLGTSGEYMIINDNDEISFNTWQN